MDACSDVDRSTRPTVACPVFMQFAVTAAENESEN